MMRTWKKTWTNLGMLEGGFLEHGLLLWLANSRFRMTLVMFWITEPKS